MPVTLDIDHLITAIFEILRTHISPTIDMGDAHGAPGQSGMTIWRSVHPFIRAAIASALAASVKGRTP